VLEVTLLGLKANISEINYLESAINNCLVRSYWRVGLILLNAKKF